MSDNDILAMRAIAEIKFYCEHYGKTMIRLNSLLNALGIDESAFNDLLAELLRDGLIVQHCVKPWTIWSNGVYLTAKGEVQDE